MSKYLLSEREGHIQFNAEKHIYTILNQTYTLSTSKVLTKYLYDDFDQNKYFDSKRLKPAEIGRLKKDWAWIRERGTAIHLRIEEYLNDVKFTVDDVHSWATPYGGLSATDGKKFNEEVDYAAEVIIDHIKLLFNNKPFLASEYRIYGKLPITGDLEVPGTIDALFWHDKEKREVIIIDWKTNRALSQFASIVKNSSSPFFNEKKTALDKYFCQLHIYKYILEQNYNVSVVGIFIFHFSPESNKVSLYSPVSECKCLDFKK